MARKSFVLAAFAIAAAGAAVSTQALAHDNAILGAVVGAGVGSVIGASVNGDPGAVLGGALGAIAGAAVSADANRHWDSGYYQEARPGTTYYAYYRTAPEFHEGPAAHHRDERDPRWHAVRYDGHTEHGDGYRHRAR